MKILAGQGITERRRDADATLLVDPVLESANKSRHGRSPPALSDVPIARIPARVAWAHLAPSRDDLGYHGISWGSTGKQVLLMGDQVLLGEFSCPARVIFDL